MAAAKEMYMQMMEDVCGGTKPYMHANYLEIEHNRAKDKAIESFRTKRKMGGDEFSEKYREQLDIDLDEVFGNFKSHNESKNIFKAARTPAVYFAIVVLAYTLSGIFGLLALYTFANFANLIMGIALLTLALWAYIRYSGELRDIGTTIDDIATFVWDSFMKPVYKKCCSQGIQYIAANPDMLTSTVQNATSSSGRNINGKVKSS